jgi:murein L,D-transpeptidase YcbB/YkuD
MPAMSRPSGALTCVLLALTAAAAHAQSDVATLINTRVDHLRNGATVVVSGRTLASRVVLPDFYERRGYEPAWSGPGRVDELLAVVQASRGDGLSPEDYHASTLDRLRAVPANPMRDADLDLLATDAVVRLAYHLRYGKIDPARIDRAWNFKPAFEGVLGARTLEAINKPVADRTGRSPSTSAR